jgi:hypothetical protein
MGRIPIDPTLTTLMEKQSFPLAFKHSQVYQPFQEIVNQLQTACKDAHD